MKRNKNCIGTEKIIVLYRLYVGIYVIDKQVIRSHTKKNIELKYV